MHTHILRRNGLRRMTMSVMLFLPATASAQAATFMGQSQEWIASIVVYAIAALNMLTWTVFLLLTQLLDTNFIFNTENGNTTFVTVLNNIWVLSRDLMNIAFALILIGAAVYTVIMAKLDRVKEYMPKFIMSVVLVNFSWFVPQLVIDASNVAASAIYGIPTLLMDRGVVPKCEITLKDRTPPAVLQCTTDASGTSKCPCALVQNAKFFLEEAEARELEGSGWYCPLGIMLCVQLTPMKDVTNVAARTTVLNGLVVNHARLQSLATVPPVSPDGGAVPAFIMFVLREIIVIAIHIALLFPLLALAVAFAVRIPVLWITMAFMPFAFLQFVVSSSGITEWPKKIWDYFLKAAILPAVVAIPLAVGFIMVNAGAQMINAGPLTDVSFKVTDGINDFWELLWLGMTLAVLWSGVFGVLKNFEGMNVAAGYLEGMGKSLGKKALSAPLSLPIIPGVGGKGISISAAAKNITIPDLGKSKTTTDTIAADPVMQGNLVKGLEDINKQLANAARANKPLTKDLLKDAFKTSFKGLPGLDKLDHTNAEAALKAVRDKMNAEKKDVSQIDAALKDFTAHLNDPTKFTK